MFDTLAHALKLVSSVRLTRTPRMADFTKWGCAVAQAVGEQQHTFLSAYHANITQQHEEAIAAHPMGVVIVAFMEEQAVWEGTPSALLNALRPIAEDRQVEKHRQFPRNANWVWRRLKEVRVNLAEKGIHCSMSHGTDRCIRLEKITKNAVGVDGAVGG
jgi:hypothetical protein